MLVGSNKSIQICDITCKCTPRYLVEVLAKYPFTYTHQKYFALIQAKDAIIRNDILFITKEYSRIKYVVDKVFFMYNSFPINFLFVMLRKPEVLPFTFSDRLGDFHLVWRGGAQ